MKQIWTKTNRTKVGSNLRKIQFGDHCFAARLDIALPSSRKKESEIQIKCAKQVCSINASFVCNPQEKHNAAYKLNYAPSLHNSFSLRRETQPEYCVVLKMNQQALPEWIHLHICQHRNNEKGKRGQFLPWVKWGFSGFESLQNTMATMCTCRQPLCQTTKWFSENCSASTTSWKGNSFSWGCCLLTQISSIHWLLTRNESIFSRFTLTGKTAD